MQKIPAKLERYCLESTEKVDSDFDKISDYQCQMSAVQRHLAYSSVSNLSLAFRRVEFKNKTQWISDKSRQDLAILKNFVTPVPHEIPATSNSDRNFNDFTMKYISLTNTISLLGAHHML